MPLFFRSKYFFLPLALLVIGGAVYVGYSLAPSPQIDQETTSGTGSSIDERLPKDSIQDSNSTIATGDNIDDFGACKEDAHNYCAGLYTVDWESYAQENDYTTSSWKYSLLDCLEANEYQTTQACDDSLSRRQLLNDAMNNACKEDRGKYCRGVVPMPGSEPQVDCLKANYENLSTACTEALDAHEAAKPEK